MRDWSAQRIGDDMIVAYIREGQHLVAQGHEASANDKFSSAFEVLVRHYQRAVVGFCVHMLRGSVDRVEDIAQEVFLAAWKTMPQFRHEASIRTWVFAITRHHCWDAVRQMGPNDVADESGEGARRETPAPVPPPDEQYAHHNLLAWVRRGLARLHSDDREVLVMTYMTELPPADIAHLLGITEAGVRTRRKRALQRLREIVTHED